MTKGTNRSGICKDKAGAGRLLLLLAVALGVARPCFGQQFFQVPVGKNPQGIALSLRFVAVGNADDNTVTLLYFPITPTTIFTVGPIPSPAGIATYGDAALVASSAANEVFVVGPSGGRLVVSRRIGVGARPIAVAASSTQQLAVVSNAGDDSLSVIDLRTFSVTQTIRNVPAATSLHGVAILERSPVAVVASTERNLVTVVDLQRFLPRAAIQVGSRPVTVEVVSGGPQVNVLNSGDGTISILSVETLAQTGVFSLGMPGVVDAGKGYVTTGSRNVLVWLGYGFILPIAPVPPLFGLAGGVITTCCPAVEREVIVATMPSANSIWILGNSENPLGVFSASSPLILNAAFGEGLAPGGLASLFLGGSSTEQAGTLPLPTTLGGASVFVGGTPRVVGNEITLDGAIPAPLLFASPTQINLQILPQLSPGPTFFERVGQALNRLRVLAMVSPTAPGIFRFSASSQAAVLNQDNTVNGPAGPLPSVHPAPRGTVIQIFSTGAGGSDPPLRAGEAAPASGNPLVLTRVQPEVKIGGVPAPVLFSGLAPGLVGVWQINAQVPLSVSPGPAVQLEVRTADTFSIATIVVQ